MCRIFVRRNADFLNESLWPELNEWLKDNLERFYLVFAPIVRNLEVDESSTND